MHNATNTKTPWARVKSLHDLKNIDFFLNSFEQLRKMAVVKTGMPLRYDKERLIYIYSRYVQISSATWTALRAGGVIIDQPQSLSRILSANLLEAFHHGTYGWIETEPATSPAELPTIPMGENPVSPNRFFVYAYVLEYYLFVLYKSLGKDYEPILEDYDMSLVEFMISFSDRRGCTPEAFQELFNALTKQLAPTD